MPGHDHGRGRLPESQHARESAPVTEIQQAHVTLQVLGGIFRAAVDEEHAEDAVGLFRSLVILALPPDW
jgi:hypothetical protein